MGCSVQLPDVWTHETADLLFRTDPIIFLSSPLANVAVADPQTEDVVVHDCIPATKYVTLREITAEDRISVEVAAIGNNPANPFYDYDFHADKVKNKLLLRYGLVFCNGDVIFARDANGALLQADFDSYISYQKLSGNGAGSIEFKKMRLAFQGDPLSFAKPDLNLTDLGVNI